MIRSIVKIWAIFFPSHLMGVLLNRKFIVVQINISKILNNKIINYCIIVTKKTVIKYLLS